MHPYPNPKPRPRSGWNASRLLGVLIAVATSAAQAQASPAEEVLVEELNRAMEVLSTQADPPHYVALSLEEQRSLRLIARDGTLDTSTERQSRYLDVDLRVGSPELDSNHHMRGAGAFRTTGRSAVVVPVSDDADYALRLALWREISDRYRSASEAIVVIRSSQNVLVEEEDPAPDFEVRAPIVDNKAPSPIVVPQAQWETLLVDLAKRLDARPEVHSTSASLTALTTTKTFVDTEGTRLVHGSTHLRVMLSVSSTADDGDRVASTTYLDVHDPSGLPDPQTLNLWADEQVAHLGALLAAPRGEPYSGPVLLRGKAAAVFFHEVLGHRVEGHRQKRDDEGKTFARYVGRPILPEFIDVYDDPTLESFEGTDLNGYYLYDDEGVPAMKAPVVEDGIFVGFLMSRSPLSSVPHSNGHGRRQLGRPPVSRMGNLIMESSQPVSDSQLRAQLVAQIKAQGLEYGIIVDEIQGGFTTTGRVMPNAFNVRASTSWKVYADGRPDELLRGIDLVGTPLVAFGNLVAAGGSMEVFNGYCGAESGMVPVSAVAPSVLFSTLEFQLKEKSENRPPLLDKPTTPEGGAASMDEESQDEG